jgi:hypothetical protein
VDELESCGRREHVFDVDAGCFSRGQADHGPHALSAGLEPVADGLGQVAELGDELQPSEVLLDELAELVGRLH